MYYLPIFPYPPIPKEKEPEVDVKIIKIDSKVKSPEKLSLCV